MTGYASKKAMGEDKLFDREAVIQYLINSDFQYIMNEDGGPELLDSYLDMGFKGYSNFTDVELKAEFEQRKEMENV